MIDYLIANSYRINETIDKKKNVCNKNVFATCCLLITHFIGVVVVVVILLKLQ